MALSADLEKKLSKKMEPLSMISMTYKGNDLSVKTDAEGNAILLFIGKKTEQGTIRGERYTRTIRKDRDDKIIKDHWELKGKAT